MTGKTVTKVKNRMGVRRLIGGHRAVERGQRLPIERERGGIVQGPAAERKQSSRRVIGGHQGGACTKLVIAVGDGERSLFRDRFIFLVDQYVVVKGHVRILHMPVGALVL